MQQDRTVLVKLSKVGASLKGVALKMVSIMMVEVDGRDMVHLCPKFSKTYVV